MLKLHHVYQTLSLDERFDGLIDSFEAGSKFKCYLEMQFLPHRENTAFPIQRQTS